MQHGDVTNEGNVTTETEYQGESECGKNSGRSAFLRKLGFKWDPFVVPVTEQEFSLAYAPSRVARHELNKVPESAVLSCFVPPKNSVHPTHPILYDLRQPQPAFVFGQPGQGKTHLRLIFEAQCRGLEDPSLVVLYEIGPDFNQDMTLTDHWLKLSRQLAIDLFIQIVERFQSGKHIVTDEQIKVLGEQIRVGGRPLQRLIERIIVEPTPDGSMGLAHRGPSVGRLAVRHVTKSDELIHLLQLVLTKSEEEEERPFDSAWSQLLSGIEAAEIWGFPQIFVLVDNVDNWQHETDGMLRLVQPLVEETIALQGHEVYCKFFLPEVLRSPLESIWHTNDHLRHTEAFFITLTWDQTELKKLLLARFRASGSRRKGFTDLSTDDFTKPLDDLLIQQSQGSPRELLELASRLINETAVANQTKKEEQVLAITPEMWQEVVTRQSS